MRAELRTALWLALRHHPLCDRFDTDRFGPLCSGCVVFWPAFTVAFAAAAAAYVGGAPAPAMLLAGGVLGMPQLLSVRWRFGRAVRAAIKLLGGVGVGLAVVGILFLPVTWPLRAGLGAMFLVASAGLIALRARSILATCDACRWRRDWARCPGFSGAYIGRSDASPEGADWPSAAAP